MKVVIMAGGKGTRIASVRSDVPKPMINICGKPILEHQIDNLKACGLTDIILVIGYLGDKIKEYDFVCSFFYNGNTKLWEYSFYSDAKRGCSCIKLAQHIDEKGGGHEHAAGCTTKNFIFK